MAKTPKKRFCFVYKTTNLVNQKYYIGCHCTFKLDDGYLGSGMRIQRSVKKYGRENFKLEILELFETRELALAREKELVTEELLKDPMCLNIQPGGGGGFNERTRRIGAKAGLKKSRWLRANDPEWKVKEFERSKESMRKRIQNGKPPKYLITFEGKHHTEESKNKIGEANKIHQSGSKNSQFGLMWITDGTDSKKIKLAEQIPDGWRKGRVKKKNLEQ